MATALARGGREEHGGHLSLVDTWLLMRNVESNGERDRLLLVLKSQGSAHSSQVREFVLTDHGAELIDVYVRSAAVVTGSARVVQEAQKRDAELAARRRALYVASGSCGGFDALVIGAGSGVGLLSPATGEGRPQGGPG